MTLPFVPKSILVLCEGNHCRSPIAEGLLKAGLVPGIRVESAGINAEKGYGPHLEAVKLMAERGIDITHHRSRPLTPDIAMKADLILVMDKTQKAWCEMMMPSTRGRVFLFGCWLAPDRQEIADPMNKSKETFARVFEALLQSADAWRDQLSTTGRTL